MIQALPKSKVMKMTKATNKNDCIFNPKGCPCNFWCVTHNVNGCKDYISTTLLEEIKSVLNPFFERARAGQSTYRRAIDDILAEYTKDYGYIHEDYIPELYADKLRID